MGRVAVRTAWIGNAAAVTALGMMLAGCGVFDEEVRPVESVTSVSADAVAKPTFSATKVDPVVVDEIYGNHHDPGLNVEWTLSGATPAPYGGVSVNLYIKNLNDVPLPPEAVQDATLKLRDYSDNLIDVEPLDKESSGVETGLDLPLGVGAKTTVSYAFNTTVGNLYSADLQVGNVIFRGSLVG